MNKAWTWLAASALALVSAQGSAQDSKALAKLPMCTACHGEGGISKTGRYPTLAGQPSTYTFLRIKQLRRAVENPEMTPIARSLSDEEIEAFADHFAKQPVAAAAPEFDKARAAKGQALAARLNCAQCHLPTYAGTEQVPRLASQNVPYLVAQMELIVANVRSDDNGNMVDLLKRVSRAEMEDMAHHFASLR